MKILQLFGFGDTNTLLSVAFRRLGYDCDCVFSNRAFVTQFPKWTRKFPELEHGAYHWDSSDLTSFNPLADLYKFVRNYDLLFVHPPGGSYAWTMGKPFVMWDGGSGNIVFDTGTAHRNKERITHEIARRSYKMAKWCFFNDMDVIYRSWAHMRWKHDNFSYAPLPTDTKLFRPMKVEPFDKFTVYLPTRQEVYNKGIDEILQGWKLFTTLVPDAQLIIARFGADVPVTEHLVRLYELEDSVAWVPVVPKPKLAEIMNRADVVIDQLTRGVLGGIADQAMSCGTRVICPTVNEWYEEWLGEAPPTIQAWNPEELAECLLECYDGKHREKERQGRRFIEKHFEFMTVAKKILPILEEIIQ